VKHAVLADTGPLYAANDKGDTHHRRALKQIEELAADGWDVLLPYPILLEAYSLVLSRLGRQAALAWLDESSDASLVNPSPDDYAQAFTIVRTLADQEISLVDATVAALSMRLKLKVWTYDHHFDVMRIPVWR
jgi:predicted nucleic acid-binding protein